jgi:hypothetical protein
MVICRLPRPFGPRNDSFSLVSALSALSAVKTKPIWFSRQPSPSLRDEAATQSKLFRIMQKRPCFHIILQILTNLVRPKQRNSHLFKPIRSQTEKTKPIRHKDCRTRLPASSAGHPHPPEADEAASRNRMRKTNPICSRKVWAAAVDSAANEKQSQSAIMIGGQVGQPGAGNPKF